MEGAAWGRWRRARRSRGGPRRRSPHFPRFSLFLLFLHLRASPSIGYLYPVQYFRQILEDAHTVKLEASLNFPVKVYVMLHHKSPHILCLTQRLRNTELIDPAFHWHAPIDNADLESGGCRE
ncbi:zona pellucida-binding protein 1-like [Macrotis lagotis]|uniref:zona pellucida-binding protein 1-like n=1 Tax=Macrotis lagotis TaxID=92651 RepID=UPI003D697BB4